MSPDTAPTPTPSPAPDSPRPRPQSLWELFWAFTLMAMQGFGGVLAVVQRILVDERQWLTIEEFVEQWSVAQVLPGPNVLNLCIILGSQYFGLAGAVVATAGILLAPFVVVLVVAALFTSVSDLAMVQGALRGLSVVVAGVIMATALRMTPALKSNPLGKWLVWGLVAATVLLVGVLHVRLIWVLMGLGTIACWLAARQLRALEVATPEGEA